MKCICVSQEQQIDTRFPHIDVLEEVTAIDETTYDGNEYWQFKEYQFWVIEGQTYRLWYDKRDFAILPSESDEVAIEAEQEAIIYQR